LAEYIQDGSWKKASPGAMLDNAVVRRDLFYLVAIFMGDQSVNGLRNSVSDLWNELSEHEITLRLASTASFLRARDDYIADEIARRDNEEIRRRGKELRSQTCGTLQEDMESEQVIPLTLREACNKVIHASDYRFDVEGEFEDSYINPAIYLYGSRQGKKGKQWRAVLDIVRYAEIGATYTTFS
jgi:hypothetical protein